MSDGREVPLQGTPTTAQSYTRAMMRVWKRFHGGVLPTKEQLGVLRAQYMAETGDVACWNHNLGNVKKADGDGYDFFFLPGTWEGVSRENFELLKKDPRWGQFVEFDNPEWYVRRGMSLANARARVAEHNAAVAPLTSVLFHPPHPFARFRAYPSFAEGFERKFRLFLEGRYKSAFRYVLEGQPELFARELKRFGYYTASADAYALACRRHFNAWMASSVYDEARAELLAEMDAPTRPDLPSVPEVEPDEPVTIDGGTVHAGFDFAPRKYDEEK
jgi:hypothetical protein